VVLETPTQGLRFPAVTERINLMSKITELASSRLNHSNTLLIILSQPDDMPESVIVHWPSMPVMIDPKGVSAAADAAVRTFLSAVVKLAQLPPLF
jgi:hypothetical protein